MNIRFKVETLKLKPQDYLALGFKTPKRKEKFCGNLAKYL
jgi:hypothetical protein